LLSIIYGLGAALIWGAADFNGGIASKRSNPYGVVAVAHSVSLGILLFIVLLNGEAIPPPQDLLWAGGAGICGGIGLLFLYRALAEGRMSVAAPVSGVLAATLPVLVSLFIDENPGVWAMFGFALALGAVWLISGGGQLKVPFAELQQPIIAGLAFGGFFIFFERSSQVSLLWPLIGVRIVSVSSLLGYALLTRQPWLPTKASLVPILLSSILDTLGNASFALSARTGRLDTAAVLSSLYPGGTVLLAWVFLKERISRLQVLGIILALSAIVMLTI
jgi:uncharacterized membrane protein